ncbi:hypothetical protein BDE02_04G034500 [Populus trichocarpa]|nr:hypothetical protein BDE02_04G034500 [Populus trichocarpa]
MKTKMITHLTVTVSSKRKSGSESGMAPPVVAVATWCCCDRKYSPQIDQCFKNCRMNAMKFFCTDSSKYVVLFCFKFSSLSDAVVNVYENHDEKIAFLQLKEQTKQWC